MPDKVMCQDEDGDISEAQVRNGLEFTETIYGPTREKKTTECVWIVDWKSWIYFAIYADGKTTKEEFKKQAKKALMKKMQKQFDDFV